MLRGYFVAPPMFYVSLCCFVLPMGTNTFMICVGKLAM